MKGRMKKGLAAVLTVVMMLTALPAFAFAETETETKETPNFNGTVYLANPDCKEAESLKALAALPLTLTIANEADPAETVAFNLEIDEFGDFKVETYDDSAQMAAIMDGVFKNQDAVLDAWMEDEITDETYYAAVFEGYTVTLNLGEDSHWTADLYDGGVTTNKDIILEFEMMIELFVSLYNALAEEFGEEPIVLTEENTPKTFEEFMLFMLSLEEDAKYDSYEDALRDPENGYTEEEIQALLAELEAQEAALAAARAETETYPTSLYIAMELHCDCSFLVMYDVYHQYLVEKDGKLEEIDCINEVGFLGDDAYFLQGEMGTVIRGEDFAREVYAGENKTYAGKAFEYVGSYDYWSEWYDLEADLSDSVLEEYTLSEDSDYDGFVLRYVLKEEPKKEQNAKPEDDNAAADGAEDSDIEPAPQTGDAAPIGTYTILLVTALAALTAAFGWKKKTRIE